MRIPPSILAAMAAALLASPVRSQEGAAPAGKDQTDESVKKVKELRKERIATLEELTAVLTKLYQIARVDYDEVLEATRLLAEARLEAAETDAERITVYKEIIALLKQSETLAAARREAGRETGVSLLKAKARRLDAEIHLEQLKIKVAKAGK